jgi:hypothetical protein
MTTDVRTPPDAPDRTVAAALAGSAAASAVVPADEAGPGTDAALAEAARAWRWVVGTEALDLYAVPEASPHWPATWIAAGGALHRARVALAAEGLQAHITLLPGASDRSLATDRLRGFAVDRHRGVATDRHRVAEGRRAAVDRSRGGAADRGRRGAPVIPHLARLVVTGTIAVTDEARELYAATDQTATLPRPSQRLAPTPAPAARPADAADAPAGPRRPRTLLSSRAVARELVRAARAEGVRLRLIRVGDEYIGVMHGPDTVEAWLRAGMACSAVRLLARRFGLRTVTAVAGADEVPPVPASPARPDRPPRPGRRRIGDREGWLNVGIGTPYLRLRLAPVAD